RVLVAGMGNVLRRDDGFGVEVVRRLVSGNGLPTGVEVIEVGIGGIHLVQELMSGYDALVLIDAVERGSPPGTMHLLEAEVPDLIAWPENARGDFLADTHYATPSKVLILSKALGVLPLKVFIFGCQPETYEEMGIGLSEAVAPTIDQAVKQVLEIVERLRSA
ncbi:MAG: hydrogenase maturation protease, partial [Anaerolineales bacterium]